MSAVNTNPVIGIVIIARHGDREGFYQDPKTYTATSTAITPVGEVQEYQLGSLLRSIYVNTSSPHYVTGLNPVTLVDPQINSTVDGGGEGSVVFDSAVALFQGLYPPNPAISTITLANGTNITSPLGGYQYIQINAVLPADAINFEGYVNCKTWANNTAALNASPAFLAKEAQATPFLTALAASGLVGGRPVALSNMWNLFDFMNVQYIHNATYMNAVNAFGASTLAQVRDLANYHEYNTFSSPTPGGIGNIAGRVFLPLIISSLQGLASPTNPIKIAHYQTAYKPFLSLFNMTNVAAAPGFQYPNAIVDYASVITLEVRENMAGNGHDVRFQFKNGSNEDSTGALTSYPLFGSSSVDTDLNTFVNNLEPYLLNNITSWCNACANTVDSGCAMVSALAQANATIASFHSDKVSPVGAGFIGAGVTIALGLALFGWAIGTGFASFGSKNRGGERKSKWHQKDSNMPLEDSASFQSSIARTN